jgi:DNA modification methylase
MGKREAKPRPSELLFPNQQRDLFEKSYLEKLEEEKNRPVECLGMTFPNEEARRKYFMKELQEKIKDPEFRKIEGFPIGSDEDILALSDPPYYTACPNPFIEDFIAHLGKPYDPNVPYSKEPFAVDVSIGKTDAIYKAHSYHTKVPHLAIVPSILHYTEPGDVVLDGFCGSGMTGIAAQWCGSAPDEYKRKVEAAYQKEGRDAPKWGTRRVVLNDLSPAATFISANYNLPFEVDAFARAGRQMLNEIKDELSWMYETLHTDGKTKALIEYTVWSEIFICPDCAGEVVFLEEALNTETKRVRDIFPCPHCGSELTKNRMERCFETRFDGLLKTTIRLPMRRPALISYKVGKHRYEKRPDEHDVKVIERIDTLSSPFQLPTDRMMHAPDNEDCWGDKWRAGTASFSHVHHLFLSRPAHALAALWSKANSYPDIRIRHMLLFFVEQAIPGLSFLNRYLPTAFSQTNRQLTGVYYIASQVSEVSPWYNLGGKLSRLIKAFENDVAADGAAMLTTGTTSRLGLPDNCIDYIFTDPPFGDNLAYAELNFVVEAFHKCFTNMKPEAIVSSHQKKGLPEYLNLMRLCFAEYRRILKPGRWMTVVFHNSRNSVWTAIQEALQYAGFVVADVRVLDKKQGSFNQAVAVGSVKQDLVISVYKANGGLEERFKLEAGTEDGVWDFIRTHLKQLPVFVSKGNQAEVIAERQNYLLFDRMVAFHVQRSVTVPMSAAEFYAGLEQRFPPRDGMYFLPEQVVEYDKKRMSVREILQLQLFVTDESSAIQWLKQQLTRKAQTFQELHPQFLKKIGGWQKNEKPLELSQLLDDTFLSYDGKEEVPSQIHSYLSTNFKALRNLSKDDKGLRAEAKDRWYVPDPNKAGDMEKKREKSLLKEFQGYTECKKKFKRNEKFRMEAVRAGFKKAWQERDYGTIISVARKIPEKSLQEDSKLLMWYDQALTRTGGD